MSGNPGIGIEEFIAAFNRAARLQLLGRRTS
jgi:hypothetical protein